MSFGTARIAITDAVDFYRQWPALRSRALRCVETGEIPPEDAELLAWMIRMIDMIGPQDVSAPE